MALIRPLRALYLTQDSLSKGGGPSLRQDSKYFLVTPSGVHFALDQMFMYNGPKLWQGLLLAEVMKLRDGSDSPLWVETTLAWLTEGKYRSVGTGASSPPVQATGFIKSGLTLERYVAG